MRIFLVLVLAATLVSGAAVLLPARAGVSEYDMVGSNPGGTEAAYSGTVTVTTSGQLLTVIWTLSDGSRVTGTGIANGDVLAVGYPSGRGYGVCLYTRDPASGIVTGYWATGGSAKVGTERWTPRH